MARNALFSVFLWHKSVSRNLFNFVKYNVSSRMTGDRNVIIYRKPIDSDLENRVSTLERWFSRMRDALNDDSRPSEERSVPSRPLPMVMPAVDEKEAERRREKVALLCQRECYPHFHVEREDREVLAVLQGLKHLEWEYRKVRQLGVFEGEVSDEEWLAVMKGPGYANVVPTRRIAWRAKYLCKAFVAQYLGSDYATAEQVFCLAGGKEIKGLKFTNISKNSDLCDEQTGKIAVMIRRAIRFAD